MLFHSHRRNVASVLTDRGGVELGLSYVSAQRVARACLIRAQRRLSAHQKRERGVPCGITCMHASMHACMHNMHECMHGCTCMLFHTGRRAPFFWRALSWTRWQDWPLGAEQLNYPSVTLTRSWGDLGEVISGKLSGGNFGGINFPPSSKWCCVSCYGTNSYTELKPVLFLP